MKNKLASRLKELRKERSLTQSDLAQAIMVPRVTYTHYELGKRTPDLDTIIFIASYFNVTVDYLVGNSDRRSWPVALTQRRPQAGDYDIESDSAIAKIAEKPSDDDKYNPFL